MSRVLEEVVAFSVSSVVCYTQNANTHVTHPDNYTKMLFSQMRPLNDMTGDSDSDTADCGLQ